MTTFAKLSSLAVAMVSICMIPALAAIRPGVPETQVTREMGRPKSSMLAGKSTILFYPQWEITITNGFVARVNPREVPTNSSPARAGASPIPVAARSSAPTPPQNGPVRWPPVLNQPYPDLILQDYKGRRVELSSFKGKVILIELVGLPNPTSQAYAGAHKKGALGGVVPQRGLLSLEESFPLGTGGIALTDNRIVFIQILLFGSHMGAPTPAEGKRWVEHFGMNAKPNHVVLLGMSEMRSRASFDMIPGFHLIDQKFVLRGVNQGRVPRSDLNRDVLGLVPKLLPKR